jgi:hypothetical protein
MEISLNSKYLENKGIQYGNLELNLLIEQLEMLFFTREGEVLGQPTFGMNLEKYLWEISLSTIEIKQYVDNKMKTYILFTQDYTLESQVRFLKGDLVNTVFIDIILESQPIFGVHVT